MALEIEYQEGQTPLDEEDKTGLKIPVITTRGELDELEQLNIQKAVEWTLTNRWNAKKVLSEKFLLELHNRMYGDVWSWAGSFRRSDQNIGVPYYKIGTELKNLWMTHSAGSTGDRIHLTSLPSGSSIESCRYSAFQMATGDIQG